VPHLVEEHQVDGLLHEVHDVVEAGCQRVDVLAVERRDEGLVDLTDHVVRDVVGQVLLLAHPLGDRLPVSAVDHHLRQQRRAVHQLVRGLAEEVVERRLHGT
jgi:nitrogen-specific signal transduction histidine kinase